MINTAKKESQPQRPVQIDITVSISGRHFYAEGDADKVLREFREWLSTVGTTQTLPDISR